MAAVQDPHPQSRPRAPRLGFLPRFGRARDGATAVEFAMLIGPFMALVFATFELGMMLLVQSTLESSAHDAARTIRTGQFQSGGGTAATYKTAICNGLGWLTADCEANLYVDVRTFPTFTAVNGPLPVTNGAFDSSKVSFQSSTACNIVLARAFYNWTLLGPNLSGLQELNGGKLLLTAATSFRNEPFSGQTC